MKPIPFFISSLVLCVGCDQVTKYAALRWLSTGPQHSYLGDTVRLTYMENRGAFLSLGAGWPDSVRWFFFTLVSLLMVLAAAWFAVQRLRVERALSWKSPVFGAVLLAAGGIGNLIDRILRDGAVIDFMNLGIGPVRTGIFNVADVQIMAAVAIFVFFKEPPALPKGEETAKSES
ncbi:MAG TPA: signal peptidase II [Polyangiaceae bacterium]|jgi:signal peptidase II|nr:signal peptidase II [Polyangiaceae bacterium]